MAEHLELAAERRELAERATIGEWREIALGEVATVRSGFAFKSSDWTNEGIPVVKIANVKEGSLALDSCSYVSDETAAKAEEFILEEGDILIAMTGYIGDVAVVRSDDLPAVLNQRVGRFSVRDPSELLQDFLFYLLRSDYVRKEIEGLGYGSAQPNISPTLIHSVDISLPPLPEQRAIAHVLGTLDDKIELNRRMNQTLEEMARALFKSWFMDFDPVRAKAALRQPALGNHAGPNGSPSPSGAASAGDWTSERARVYLDAMDPQIVDLFPDRLVPSELGEIPEGWEVKELGAVAQERRDGLSPTQIDPSAAYIALEHMPRRCIALEAWGSADGLASAKFKFTQGDILFGKLRPYFHKVGVAPFDGVCSTDIVVMSPASPEWFSFVLGHASSSEFVDYTDAVSTGTRMPRTKWTDMARFRVALPDRELASAFNCLVHPWASLIVSAIHQSHAVGAQRDALLPELISGKLAAKPRVSEEL